MLNLLHGILNQCGRSYELSVLKTNDIDTITESCRSLAEVDFAPIDDTHILMAYQGDGGDGYVSVLAIASDGTVTQVSYLEHHDRDINHVSIFLEKLSDTAYIVIYKDDVGDEQMTLINVNASTYAITTIDKVEFESVSRYAYGGAFLSATEGIAFWEHGSNLDYDKIWIEGTDLRNLSGGTLISVGEGIEDAKACKIDSTHFLILVACDNGNMYAYVYNYTGHLATPSYVSSETVISAVATSSPELELIPMGDGEHFLCAGKDSSGYHKIRSISIDADNSYAISFDDFYATYTSNSTIGLSYIDSKHYAFGYSKTTEVVAGVLNVDDNNDLSLIDSLNVVSESDSKYVRICHITETLIAVYYETHARDLYLAIISVA